MAGIVRRLINQQVRWSRAIDQRLPPELSVDARRYFHKRYLTEFVTPRARIYDVGGGRFPAITSDQKARQNLWIAGIDLVEEELKAAPAGIYDQTAAADITSFQGREDADLIICETVIEHVRDTEQTFRAFRSILKPGGLAILLVPCRNAIFARMNRILPEAWKRRLLSMIYPTLQGQGWPAFYDRCTPLDFRRLAATTGFEIVDLKVFYYSAYFQFCSPIYALWRLWVLLARAVSPERAAETFCVCLRKLPEVGQRPEHEMQTLKMASGDR